MFRGRVVRLAVRFAAIIVVVGFWAGYLRQNAAILLEQRWSLDIWPAAGAVAAATVAFGLFGAAWYISFRAVGGSVPPRRGLRRWYQSLLARYAPGGVWHIAGRAYLLRGDQQSPPLVLVSGLLEIILSALAALFVAAIGLMIAPAPDWLRGLAGLGGLACLVAMHPVLFRLWIRLGALPIRFLTDRFPKFDQSDTPYEPVLESRLRQLGYGRTLLIFAPYVAGSAVAALSTILTAVALGADLDAMIRIGWAAFGIAWFVGFIVVLVPGGIGAREAALTLILETFVGPAGAVATAAMSRVFLTGGELAAVAIDLVAVPPEADGPEPQNPAETG